MNHRKHLFAPLLLLFTLLACGGNGETDPLANADWRTITNSGKILAGITVDGTFGTLAVENNSDSKIAVPSLSIYDLESGEATAVTADGAAAVAAGSSTIGTFSFPSGSAPEDTALMLLYIGDAAAAVFVTAESYANLSPAVLYPATEPDSIAAISAKFTTITVLSGNWDFSMDLSASYLTGTNCPNTSPSYTTSGETAFYFSDNNYVGSWHVYDNVVVLNSVSSSNTLQSQTYSFPVETEDESTVYGTNYWQLTPTSSTYINGTLEWDNSLGCTASYPITLEYQTPATPFIWRPCDGTWNVDYSLITCGMSSLSAASLTILPFPTAELNTTYYPAPHDDEPLFMELSSFNGFEAVYNCGNSNTYGSAFPNIQLGSVTGPLGYPIQIVGGIQLTVVSETLIMGTIVTQGYGYPPCSGIGIFTMTHADGGC